MKKEELTLEQEFKSIVIKHKCLIIAGAIYAFEDEITGNQLLKDVIAKTKPDNNEDFHVDMTRRLVEYSKKYNSERFEQVYNLCWEKSKKFLPENEAYTTEEFDDWDFTGIN